jgi:hypothetical protein
MTITFDDADGTNVITFDDAVGSNDGLYTGLTLHEVVPEPSTFALATFGLLGLIGFGRRRKR